MTTTNRAKRTTLERSLLVGVLVFAMMFLWRLYVVPVHPDLDGPLVAALAGSALAAGAWWIAFRRRGAEPDAGGFLDWAGSRRVVRGPLLTGAIVIVLYLFFRLCLLPLLPGLDGLLGAALAAGVAGGIAQWLVNFRRRS